MWALVKEKPNAKHVSINKPNDICCIQCNNLIKVQSKCTHKQTFQWQMQNAKCDNNKKKSARFEILYPIWIDTQHSRVVVVVGDGTICMNRKNNGPIELSKNATKSNECDEKEREEREKKNAANSGRAQTQFKFQCKQNANYFERKKSKNVCLATTQILVWMYSKQTTKYRQLKFEYKKKKEKNIKTTATRTSGFIGEVIKPNTDGSQCDEHFSIYTIFYFVHVLWHSTHTHTFSRFEFISIK